MSINKANKLKGKYNSVMSQADNLDKSLELPSWAWAKGAKGLEDFTKAFKLVQNSVSIFAREFMMKDIKHVKAGAKPEELQANIFTMISDLEPKIDDLAKETKRMIALEQTVISFKC